MGWILTRRPHGLNPEPATLVALPGLEACRLRTEDGIELGTWIFHPGGRSPMVLLLHGNGSSRSKFAQMIPFLAGEGFGGMAVSLRAHGASGGETNDFGYSARRDVVAAVQTLEGRWPGRPIVIVGESLGAAAALFAARECADSVRGYVLAAPYGSLDSAVWNRCDGHFIPPFSQAAYAGLQLWAPVFLPVSAKEISPGDHLREIPETTPVTIFASEADRSARIDEVRSLAETVRTHGRLVVARSGGHGNFLKLHEDEYRKEILELLRRVEDGK